MDATNGHADLLDDPVLQAMETWKLAGVLDAPQRVDALSKSLRAATEQTSSKTLQLERENSQLRNELAEVKGTVEGIAKSLQTIAQMVSNRPEPVQQQQPSQTILNLSASGLAEQLGEVLSKSVADVIYKTLERAISAPVTNVSMDVEALGQCIAGQMLPVLKAIADRPEPVAPSVRMGGPNVAVDMAPVAKALDDLRELVTKAVQPVQQQPVDLSPLNNLADAVNEQSKVLRKAIDSTKPQDLTPILKAVSDGNAESRDAVTKAIAQMAPKNKRVSQDPDTGDLLVRYDT